MSIRISNVDWTNDKVFQIRKMCSSRKGKMAARNVLGGVYQPGKALSMPKREEIINLYNQGYHTKEISQDLKVTERTVRNILDHFRHYGIVHPLAVGSSQASVMNADLLEVIKI